MNRAALLLVLLDFLAIGALPIVFFRRKGPLSSRWWLTAWPFFACPALLIGAWAGVLDGSSRLSSLLPGQDLLGVSLAAASLALLFLTMGTHRIPIAYFHQDDDAPRELVTWGPYRHVRHPFYASFLLAFGGAAACLPHPAMLALALYAAVALNLTAAREERRLALSPFGAEYTAYRRRTGRFLPRARQAA